MKKVCRHYRVCKECCEKRKLIDFHKHAPSPGGRKSECRFCSNRRRAEYHATKGRLVQKTYKKGVISTNRRLLVEYLMSCECEVCGESNPVVLDFHHRGNKEANVSSMLSRSYPWHFILAEIQKCDVLCANCHRMRHAFLDGHWKAGVVAEVVKELNLKTFDWAPQSVKMRISDEKFEEVKT